MILDEMIASHENMKRCCVSKQTLFVGLWIRVFWCDPDPEKNNYRVLDTDLWGFETLLCFKTETFF